MCFGCERWTLENVPKDALWCTGVKVKSKSLLIGSGRGGGERTQYHHSPLAMLRQRFGGHGYTTRSCLPICFAKRFGVAIGSLCGSVHCADGLDKLGCSLLGHPGWPWHFEKKDHPNAGSHWRRHCCDHLCLCAQFLGHDDAPRHEWLFFGIPPSCVQRLDCRPDQWQQAR